MRDLLLQCAGLGAVAVALAHGVIGEKIFARVTIEPARLRTLIRMVWQCSTVAWIGGGVLLIAASLQTSDAARHWIVATVAATYAFGAVGNALVTRGRHFGWMAMGAVIGLAVAGY